MISISTDQGACDQEYLRARGLEAPILGLLRECQRSTGKMPQNSKAGGRSCRDPGWHEAVRSCAVHEQAGAEGGRRPAMVRRRQSRHQECGARPVRNGGRRHESWAASACLGRARLASSGTQCNVSRIALKTPIIFLSFADQSSIRNSMFSRSELVCRGLAARSRASR